MSRRRIVIVGGSDAGTSAALSARATDPDCQIDVLLEDRYPNYSVCGLPFLLSGEVRDWRSLAHRSESEFVEQRISLHKEWHVVGVDSGSHELTARGPDGERRFDYDRLVFATGAEAVLPPIAGLDLEAEAVTQRVAEGEQPGRSGKVGGRRIGAAAGELIVLLKIAADGAADIKATLASRPRRVGLRPGRKSGEDGRGADQGGGENGCGREALAQGHDFHLGRVCE